MRHHIGDRDTRRLNALCKLWVKLLDSIDRRGIERSFSIIGVCERFLSGYGGIQGVVIVALLDSRSFPVLEPCVQQASDSNEQGKNIDDGHDHGLFPLLTVAQRFSPKIGQL